VRRPAVLIATVFALAAGATPAAAETQELTFTAPNEINLTPFGVAQGAMVVPSPQQDGYVVGMWADVVDMKGRSMNVRRVMLHHIVFASVLGQDATCTSTWHGGEDGSIPMPKGISVERFYAMGEERAKMQLPPGYGYPNSAEKPWGVGFMLMNHRNVDDKARIRFHVTYVTGEQLTPVRPYWLDVRNCDTDPVFDAPGTGGPRSQTRETWDYTMPESGRIVAAGGHLHGGGIALTADDVTAGRQLFDLRPRWGLPGSLPYQVRPVLHEPGPIHMTAIQSAQGIPIGQGDVLRLTATYDNSRPHTRSMGISVMYVAPDPTASAASPMPTDIQRLDDVPEDTRAMYGSGRPGAPPKVIVPLFRAPEGRIWTNPKRARLGDVFIAPERVALTVGRTLRWRWKSEVSHNLTIASGPEGFSSRSLTDGDFRHTFSRPGTYRLFCTLHPTLMVEEVVVRTRRAARRASPRAV
jgi:plastocyanin